MRQLNDAGIPAGILIPPLIPGLTDHEIPRISKPPAGPELSSRVILCCALPHGVAQLFETWLEQHFPEKKSKVMSRVRELRGGEVTDGRFGSRMKGEKAR